MYEEFDVSVLLGKTLHDVNEWRPDEIEFELVRSSGKQGALYRMCHHQDCCERVRLVGIHGTLRDLVGSPIIVAESVLIGSVQPGHVALESFRWSVFRFATADASVTLSWCGTATDFCSSSCLVSFARIKG